MLLVFQHPVIDFRPLVDDNYRLPMPDWPVPEDENMMRYIGITKRRLKGGTTSWSGEHKFCTARKAIQHIDLEKHRIKFNDNTFLKTAGAFRRINSNGNFLVKFEIGVSNDFEEYLTKISETKNYFEFLLSEYCKLKVKIRNPLGENVLSEISHCGRLLAELYLYSTSSYAGISNDKIEKWWTAAGEPVCIIECADEDNTMQLPKYTKKIKEYPGARVELHHYWADLAGNKKIRTWIIKITDFFNYEEDFVRNLRLNLLRINAEKETLRKVLNLLQRKGNELIDTDEKIARIGTYLEKHSSKLLKEIRYGIDQNDIIDVALKAEETARPGELESYIETLTPLRNRYVTSNVEQIVHKGVTINVTGGEIHELNVTENGNIIKNGHKN
jgi:hypothetical protein